MNEWMSRGCRSGGTDYFSAIPYYWGFPSPFTLRGCREMIWVPCNILLCDSTSYNPTNQIRRMHDTRRDQVCNVIFLPRSLAFDFVLLVREEKLTGESGQSWSGDAHNPDDYQACSSKFTRADYVVQHSVDYYIEFTTCMQFLRPEWAFASIPSNVPCSIKLTTLKVLFDFLSGYFPHRPAFVAKLAREDA